MPGPFQSGTTQLAPPYWRGSTAKQARPVGAICRPISSRPASLGGFNERGSESGGPISGASGPTEQRCPTRAPSSSSQRARNGSTSPGGGGWAVPSSSTAPSRGRGHRRVGTHRPRPAPPPPPAGEGGPAGSAEKTGTNSAARGSRG